MNEGEGAVTVGPPSANARLWAAGRARAPAIGACALSTAAAVTLLSATGQDDSHITYWAARALAEHGGIVNHAGARVEQSSSLLLTLVLALLYRITPLTMPTLGYAVSIAAGWLAVLRAGALAGLRGAKPSPALVFAAMTSPLLAYWTLGGMETTLVAWLFVEVAVAQGGAIEGRFAPASARVALVTLAFAMARPETGIIDACALFGVLGVLALHALRAWKLGPTRAPMARVAVLLGVTVACSLSLAGFRLAYFGELVPQPVAVKVGGPITWAAAKSGLLYVEAQLTRGDTGVLVACLPAAIVYLLFRRDRRGEAWFPPMLLIAHFGFVILNRGDWMVGGRFVAHAVPLLAYLLFRAAGSVPRHVRVVLVAALALGNLAGLVYVAGKLAPGRPLWNSIAVDRSIRESTGGVTVPWVDRANQTHTRDALFIGALERVIDRLLEQKPRVTIMSGQAGMVMYYVASRYYGKVDFIDRHALTSRQLVEPGRALGLPMLSTGLEVSVPQFFQIAARHPELYPDIVFDLNRQRRDAAVQNGYTCVYEQMGNTGASPPSWFTVRGNVYQFIAVPNALVDAVMQGETPPRVFRWTHEP